MPLSFEVEPVNHETLTPVTVSLLHWNVWHGSNPGEIIDILAQANPDIICLHELSLDSSRIPGVNVAERIRDDLSIDGFIENVHHLKGKNDSRYSKDAVGIFSKFPIANPESVMLSKTGWDAKYKGEDYRRKYFEAVVSLPEGNKITVGTVHLSLLRAEIGNRGVRKVETEQLINIIGRKQDDYILTGDFNASVYSQSVRAMASLLTRLDGVLAVPTWKVKGIGLKRLDYIFVTPNINVVGGEVLEQGPSDHNPLQIYVE